MTASSPVAPDSTDSPVRIEDGDDLDRLLDAHDRVLVDFYTKGCTLCQSIELREDEPFTSLTVATSLLRILPCTLRSLRSL